MTKRLRSGRRSTPQEVEVNVLPVMNLFLVLIPFLLLTAVFAQTAIFELSLPSESEPSATSTEDKAKALPVAIALTNEAFTVVIDGKLAERLPHLSSSEYDYAALTTALIKVKAEYPDSRRVVLIPDDEVFYEQIVEVMGRCTRSGFSDVAFSGGIQ